MNLTELKKGEIGVIKKIKIEKGLKKRLVDMGVINGTTIFFERTAPLGDPLEFRVIDSSIAIRKEDAVNIQINIIENIK